VTIVPVLGEPALLDPQEKRLVVADLHLGLEGELLEKGICLPSQIPETKERLFRLVVRYQVKKILFLGDVKHNVPRATWREWSELPLFFEELIKKVEVEVVPGNHDGDLEGMIPKGVKILPVTGVRYGEVGFVHGHAWPSREVLETKQFVMGHNHPAIELRDEVGGKVVEPVWLKVKLDSEKLPEEVKVEKPPELIVMPSFSKLVKGAPVNKQLADELIGPLFRCGAANLEEAEVYLLDGTYLGKVGEL
jgi:putative SbcD/Mre11-related phosphoesterase